MLYVLSPLLLLLLRCAYEGKRERGKKRRSDDERFGIQMNMEIAGERKFE
jgi:hypothetical protein